MCAGICRFVKVMCNRPDLNFLKSDNITFGIAKQALDTQWKKATTLGIGVIKNKPTQKLKKMKNLLWEKGLLGTATYIYYLWCALLALLVITRDIVAMLLP